MSELPLSPNRRRVHSLHQILLQDPDASKSISPSNLLSIEVPQAIPRLETRKFSISVTSPNSTPGSTVFGNFSTPRNSSVGIGNSIVSHIANETEVKGGEVMQSIKEDAVLDISNRNASTFNFESPRGKVSRSNSVTSPVGRVSRSNSVVSMSSPRVHLYENALEKQARQLASIEKSIQDAEEAMKVKVIGKSSKLFHERNLRLLQEAFQVASPSASGTLNRTGLISALRYLHLFLPLDNPTLVVKSPNSTTISEIPAMNSENVNSLPPVEDALLSSLWIWLTENNKSKDGDIDFETFQSHLLFALDPVLIKEPGYSKLAENLSGNSKLLLYSLVDHAASVKLMRRTSNMGLTSPLDLKSNNVITASAVSVSEAELSDCTFRPVVLGTEKARKMDENVTMQRRTSVQLSRSPSSSNIPLLDYPESRNEILYEMKKVHDVKLEKLRVDSAPSFRPIVNSNPESIKLAESAIAKRTLSISPQNFDGKAKLKTHDALHEMRKVQKNKLADRIAEKIKEEKETLFIPNRKKSRSSSNPNINGNVHDRLFQESSTRIARKNSIASEAVEAELSSIKKSMITTKIESNNGVHDRLFKQAKEKLSIIETVAQQKSIMCASPRGTIRPDMKLLNSKTDLFITTKDKEHQHIPTAALHPSYISTLVTSSRDVQKLVSELEECTWKPMVDRPKRSASVDRISTPAMFDTFVERARSANKQRTESLNFFESKMKKLEHDYDERMKSRNSSRSNTPSLSKSNSCLSVQNNSKHNAFSNNSSCGTPVPSKSNIKAPFGSSVSKFSASVDVKDKPKTNKIIKSNTVIQKSSSVKSGNLKFTPKLMLYVDVNLGGNKSARIDVYENDDPEMLAKKFSAEHSLNSKLSDRLVTMLKKKIDDYLSAHPLLSVKNDENYEDSDSKYQIHFNSSVSKFKTSLSKSSSQVSVANKKSVLNTSSDSRKPAPARARPKTALPPRTPPRYEPPVEKNCPITARIPPLKLNEPSVSHPVNFGKLFKLPVPAR